MKQSINKVTIIAILWASLLATGNLQAATIAWGPATNIVNDTDISTKGVLRYAELWAGTDGTVNGVTFKVMQGDRIDQGLHRPQERSDLQSGDYP